MKKLLSIITVLTLCLSMLPVTALAVESDERIACPAAEGYEENIYFDAATGAIIDCDENATSVEIPSTINGVAVTGIGDGAFNGCGNLTGITIPAGVTSIGAWAFSLCRSLTSVTIPAGVAGIGDHAFEGCSNLTSVTIPASVTSIGEAVFWSCSSLTSITIPAGAASIGDDVFEGCSSLTSISVDPENLNFASDDGVLFNKQKSILIRYPEGKTDILYTIPDSVTSIDSSAFWNCGSLTGITIPASVTSIGKEAFANCSGLINVYYAGSESKWGEIAIDESGNSPLTNAIIHYNSTGPKTYALTVTRGTGGGEYAEGAEVTITANAAPEGKAFDKWTTDDGVTFENEASATATFTMPAKAVTVTANYKDVYRLTVEGGTIDGGATAGDYAVDQDVTITAIVPDGKEFDKWTTSGGGTFADPASGTTTFTMPANEVTVTANYKDIATPPTSEQTYTLTVNGGTGGGEYAKGAKVTITADAAPEGKAFDKWTTSGGGTFADPASATTTFTMPANEVTVTATYKDVYRLTVKGGTIDGGAAAGDYAVGQDVTITAIVPNGKVFDKWTTSNGGTFKDAASGTTTFTMPDNDVTVTANYKDVYRLTVEGGTIDGGATAGDYAVGQDVTITAIVPNGKVFDKWTTSNGGTFKDAASATTTFTMPDNDVTVTANYKPLTYTVTVNGGTGGGEYEAGQTVTIKAIVPNGQQFIGWTVGEGGVTLADSSSEETTFTMPANDVTVTAAYEDIASPPTPTQTYTLTVTGGTGSGKYAAGAKVTITAYAAPEGKAFNKWTAGSGVIFADAASATTSFIMPANDVTVTATYKDATTTPEQTYTLTVTGGTGGGEYAAGAKAAIKANAAPEGKAFDKWTTSGGGTFADPASASTTFTMPAHNVTVTATYKDIATPPASEQTYTLTVSGGTINNGTDSGKYAEGAKVTITADAAPEGKVFDKWTTSSGGTFEDETSETTTFTMPANDVTVTATYRDATAPERIAYVISFDPNGGTVDIPCMVTGTDGRLPVLPIPFYSGHIFNGWYTAPTGGSLISRDTVFDGNATVYAQWVLEHDVSDSSSSPLTEYAVIVPSTTGGTVAVNREYAARGTSISITVTPDRGYEMTSLIARDSWWNELKLTDRGGGRYTLTMPDRSVTVNATFTAITTERQPEPVVRPVRVWPYPGFTDVSASAWYYDAVRFVCETGLMNGLSSTTFSPYDNLSRAQLTQILYNMAGSPAAGSVSGFADVVPSSWYANAVAWAVSRNIIDGFDGGIFGPYDYVTREEIVVMLWRYAGEPASEEELYFSDTANISTYTQTAVRWAVEKGILTGNSDGALTPKGLATRAQVAQMLKNYFDS